MSPFVYRSAGQYTFFRFEKLIVFFTGSFGAGGGGSLTTDGMTASATTTPCRTQSFGRLSDRARRYTAWRSRPSEVHSRNCTSHTYIGSTHVVVLISGIASVVRPPITGPRHGGVGRTIGVSRSPSSRSSWSLNPVPTRPA